MKEESKNLSYSNESISDTSSVLQIRLDSAPILERVKVFLTGNIQTVVYDDGGKPFVKTEEVSKPKANKDGIHWLVNFVENVINPQAVQGNFDRDQYDNYISEVHDGLLTNVMNNLHLWGIDENDYEPICDTIMVIIIPFISRLIGNKERDSYGQSMRVVESSSAHTGKTGFFK